MAENKTTSYPNQETAQQVLASLAWRHNEIEQMQKTINKLIAYAKSLPDYEGYKESIESYQSSHKNIEYLKLHRSELMLGDVILDVMLDKYGQKGWELVTTSNNSNGKITWFYFKREIQE